MIMILMNAMQCNAPIIALTHVDASKKDLINLLPILAEIAPQLSARPSSSSSHNGDAILIHVERFLMDIFTVIIVKPMNQ